MGSKPSSLKAEVINRSNSPILGKGNVGESGLQKIDHNLPNEGEQDGGSCSSKSASSEPHAIIQHLTMKANLLRMKSNNPIESVQDALMQELGVTKPDSKDLEAVMQAVCADMDQGFAENEILDICNAFPDASARLAENGSPLAAFLKDIPLHRPLALALDQVLGAKKVEGKCWLGGEDELISRPLKGRGEMESGNFESNSLSTLRNIDKMDLSRAVYLAHENLVSLLWQYIDRVNKSRKDVHAHVKSVTREITDAMVHDDVEEVNRCAEDLEIEIYEGHNFSAPFNLLVPSDVCLQEEVPMGSAKLGILRSLLGDMPCSSEDEMLQKMRDEHKNDPFAHISFTPSTGTPTTPQAEWINSMQDHGDLDMRDKGNITPIQGRSLASNDRNTMLDLLRACPESEAAGLTRSEGTALLLLVGPMREVYNWRLAGALDKQQNVDSQPSSRSSNVRSTNGFLRNSAVSDKSAGSGNSEEPGKSATPVTVPRAFKSQQPRAFEARAFHHGFEVTLHCACTALMKLARIAHFSRNCPLYKGLPGGSAMPELLRTENKEAREVGFMVCTSHVRRVVTEFREDWKSFLSTWEICLRQHERGNKLHEKSQSLARAPNQIGGQEEPDYIWEPAPKIDKMMNAIFEIHDPQHAAVDLTWVSRACGRVAENAPTLEIVIFPPFCNLHVINNATVQVLHPKRRGYEREDIGKACYEFCSVPLAVNTHQGLYAQSSEEVSMAERRKALHERLANETLFDLTSTVKCFEKWEEKELQDVASALHYPLELYDSDSKFCNVFKDLLDAKVAVLNKRKWSNCIETHEAGKSWVAKTPSLQEAPTALETIVSGVELVSSPQKNKCPLWLEAMVEQVPANFFLTAACIEKIENDFAAVPWSYLARAASPEGDVDGINGYQLPPSIHLSCANMRIMWDYVLQYGIRRVRSRQLALGGNNAERSGGGGWNVLVASDQLEDASLMGDMEGDTNAIGNLSDYCWEVQTVEKMLKHLQEAQFTADLRFLGIDLLKLAAPIVANNSSISRVLLGNPQREMKINEFRNVQTIDLTHSNLGDDQCVMLAEMLRSHADALHTLDLRGNMLGREGDSALALVLRDLTTLTCLSGISIDEERTSWDLNTVQRPMYKSTAAFLTCRVQCNVERLFILDGFRAGVWMARGLLKDKPYMLPFVSSRIRVTSMDNLVLADNALYDLNLRELWPDICKSSYLKTLDLSGNGLRADACCAFAQAIIKYRGNTDLNAGQGLQLLQVLNLAHNYIDDDACVVLAVCLSRMRFLKKLDFSDNCIRTIGCIALARALSNLDQFSDLILDGNDLLEESQGVCELRQMCPQVLVHGVLKR